MNPELEILNKVADTVLAYRPKAVSQLPQFLNQGDEIYVDSREVARLFEIEHKNLRETMEEHAKELNELGVYRFETAKPIRGSTKGGRPEKYAYISFDHVAYLLATVRTTAEKRKLRVGIFLMFKKARQKLRPVDALLLSIPTAWKLTFTDEFYIALLQLYKASFDASKNKPSWVGRWTNRYIYEPIFSGLPAEMKQNRAQYGDESGKETDYLKLHQFLHENAKEALRDHKSKITGFLQIAKTKQDFEESFAALFGGGKQSKLSEEIS